MYGFILQNSLNYVKKLTIKINIKYYKDKKFSAYIKEKTKEEFCSELITRILVKNNCDLENSKHYFNETWCNSEEDS